MGQNVTPISKYQLESYGIKSTLYTTAYDKIGITKKFARKTTKLVGEKSNEAHHQNRPK